MKEKKADIPTLLEIIKFDFILFTCILLPLRNIVPTTNTSDIYKKPQLNFIKKSSIKIKN